MRTSANMWRLQSTGTDCSSSHRQAPRPGATGQGEAPCASQPRGNASPLAENRLDAKLCTQARGNGASEAQCVCKK